MQTSKDCRTQELWTLPRISATRRCEGVGEGSVEPVKAELVEETLDQVAVQVQRLHSGWER